jgi:hypothetical protein
MKFSGLDTSPGGPQSGPVQGEGPTPAAKFGGFKVQVSQSTIVRGASAGAAAFAVVKFGLADKVPSIDGISRGIVLVALGFALAALVRPGGVLDDVAEGAGFGLIAVGALHIGG